jgi:hypothetical protein
LAVVCKEDLPSDLTEVEDEPIIHVPCATIAVRGKPGGRIRIFGIDQAIDAKELPQPMVIYVPARQEMFC